MVTTPIIGSVSATTQSQFKGKQRESLLVEGGAQQLRALVDKLERGSVGSADYGREFMATINMPVYQARMNELLEGQPEVVSELAKLDASDLSPDVLAIRSFKALRKNAPEALATINGELYTEAGFSPAKVSVMVEGMFKPEAMEAASNVINSMYSPEDSRAQQTKLAARSESLKLAV